MLGTVFVERPQVPSTVFDHCTGSYIPVVDYVNTAEIVTNCLFLLLLLLFFSMEIFAANAKDNTI